MLKVGLTGGIGSGKTTVAGIFELLGIPVYYADSAAKRLMNEDPVLREQIITHFGNDVYQQGQLNRKYLASVVFADKEKLALLNSLVHPATIRDSEAWVLQHKTPYVLREAALIFESGVYSLMDYVIGVSAPDAVRMMRVTQRDKISMEQVQDRIKNQWDEELKMSRCDFLLFNDDQQLLIPQVINLHERLVTLAAASTL